MLSPGPRSFGFIERPRGQRAAAGKQRQHIAGSFLTATEKIAAEQTSRQQPGAGGRASATARMEK